ncbi:MAG TPA: cupin domain-containing protein [Anaerolineales bacterium]|nr:cupin domain-containing protein [Anaerolineales bacterium]
MSQPLEQTGSIMPDTINSEVVTVRPESEIMSRQRLPYFVGVSHESAGATGISMNLVIIPPGGAAEAHLHRGYETAIYLIQGQVQTRYGPGLQKSVINQSGDFIFIPANVPHQPVNLSQTEAAIAVVARNDPNEQESVEHYNPQTAPSNLAPQG